MVHASMGFACLLSLLGGDVTCLIRVAEDGLLLMGTRAVSHPHRDGKGLLQVGPHHALRNLDSLRTIELKDLVTVVSVVCGQSDGPVGGAAGCRQKLYSARTGSLIKSGQSQTIKGGMEANYRRSSSPRLNAYLPQRVCRDFSEYVSRSHPFPIWLVSSSILARMDVIGSSHVSKCMLGNRPRLPVPGSYSILLLNPKR